MPEVQVVQDADPGVPEKDPAGQDVHSDELPPEYCPAGQESHELDPAVANVPDVHVVHAAAPIPEAEPPGQTTQDMDPAPPP